MYDTLPVSGPMEPKDFIWLAALGMAAREAVTVDDIWAVIDEIAAPLWTPASAVVESAVEDLLAEGALRLSAPGMVEVTARGRRILSSLFGRPHARPGCPLGQVGLRLKLAFADLTSPEERQHYLALSIRAYEGEIAECERRCQPCSHQGSLGRQWLDHQADRLRRELSLLHSMAADTSALYHSLQG